MADNAYLIASRQGLYRADRQAWRLLAEGAFFGIACVGGDVFAFRHDPRPDDSPPLSGRKPKRAAPPRTMRPNSRMALRSDRILP